MEEILLAYDLPKEIITTIMILYKNMKTMVLQGDTLAPCIYKLCRSHMLKVKFLINTKSR